MKKSLLILFTLIALAVLGRMCVFTVDRTEYVYVTQFGEYVATYDGSVSDQAGLHFRWPWPIQSLTRVERRMQILDLPPVELVTTDPREGGSVGRTLNIDAYLVWRIPNASAVERFILNFGTMDRAREVLRDRFRSRLGTLIPGMQLDELISESPGQVDRQRLLLREKLMAQSDESQTVDGVEIVDVRIRRINYPAPVRQAIFERIISERQIKVAEAQSRGRTGADIRKAEADAAANIKLDAARAKGREDRARADAQAELILNDAIRKDPAYYEELKRRELAELALNVKKRVWSTRLFDVLFPRLESMKMPHPGGP